MSSTRHNYTKETKEWLDERFTWTDKNGYYLCHQPIYGFENTLSALTNYIRTYGILHEIEILSQKASINNFLDSGCAEGYTANMIQNRFGWTALCADLSIEACKRAKEIFSLEGVSSDIHSIPLKDNSVDLVLCSETIEHLVAPDKAISELMRVAKKYVVITTPAARSEYEKTKHYQSIDENEPHRHLNIFTTKDMIKMLGEEGTTVKGIMFRPLNDVNTLIVGFDVDELPNIKKISTFRKIKVSVYKIIRSVLLFITYDLHIAMKLIKINHVFSSRFISLTHDHLIIKKVGNFVENKKFSVQANDLLNYMLIKNIKQKHRLPKIKRPLNSWEDKKKW